MSAVGEALVEVLLRAFVDTRPRVRQMVDWITEVSRPPSGVRLVADDGGAYTGLVFVEANRPRLMLALRVGTEAPSATHRREPHHIRHELDDELWPRDQRPIP